MTPHKNHLKILRQAYVQIQTFDNQTPVFYLGIWQRSEDFKHLIPRTGSNGKQG